MAKTSREITKLLENLEDKQLAALNAISSDLKIWTELDKLVENLVAREEYYAMSEIKPYKSMDDLISGSTKQVQRQGRALGVRFLRDLIFFSKEEFVKRENGTT